MNDCQLLCHSCFNIWTMIWLVLLSSLSKSLGNYVLTPRVMIWSMTYFLVLSLTFYGNIFHLVLITSSNIIRHRNLVLLDWLFSKMNCVLVQNDSCYLSWDNTWLAMWMFCWLFIYLLYIISVIWSNICTFWRSKPICSFSKYCTLCSILLYVIYIFFIELLYQTNIRTINQSII